MFSLFNYLGWNTTKENPRTFKAIQFLPNGTVNQYVFYNKYGLDDITHEVAQLFGVASIDKVLSINNRDSTLVALYPQPDNHKSRINHAASDFMGRLGLNDMVIVFRTGGDAGGGICSLELDSVFPLKTLTVVQIAPSGSFATREVQWRTPAEIRESVGKHLMRKHYALPSVKLFKNKKLGFACFYFECDASRHATANHFAVKFVPGKCIDGIIYVCKLSANGAAATFEDTQVLDVDKLFRMDEVRQPSPPSPPAATAVPEVRLPTPPAAESAPPPTATAVPEVKQPSPPAAVTAPLVVLESSTPVVRLPTPPPAAAESAPVSSPPPRHVIKFKVPETPVRMIPEKPVEVIPEPAAAAAPIVLEEEQAQLPAAAAQQQQHISNMVDRIVNEVIEKGKKPVEEEEQQVLPKRKVLKKRQRNYQNYCDVSLENIVVVPATAADDDSGPRRSTRQRKQVLKE